MMYIKTILVENIYILNIENENRLFTKLWT